MKSLNIVLAIFYCLIGSYTLAKSPCLPGVYTDGKTHAVVLQEKPNVEPGPWYLTFDGLFGNSRSDSRPFECHSGFIRLRDREVTHLNPVALRRTPTRFFSANTQLVGELVEPVKGGQQPYPLVVMVHGSEQEPAIGSTRASLLAAMGIAVFTYDKRGTGESEGFYTQNFELLAADAAAALNHARSLTSGRTTRVGFWGASQGGWVAPLAATLAPVDFVVVSYGLVASPIEEDLDQMLLEAKQQQLDENQQQQIRRLSKITAKILLSHFDEGLNELDVLRKEVESQTWINTINGEYSGAMLRMSHQELHRIGRAVFDNLELIWNYEALPVLKKLHVPMLWIMAEKDREAPAQRTIQALALLKKENTQLQAYIFPNTDHGMYEFEELSNGTRNNLRVTEGYFRLIVEWIHGNKRPYSGHGILH